RRRGGDGRAPPADAARSAAHRVARGCPAAGAAFQGRQADARGAGSNPDEGRFSDTGRSTALFERHATGCRRMSRPACRLAARRPREEKTPVEGDINRGRNALTLRIKAPAQGGEARDDELV